MGRRVWATSSVMNEMGHSLTKLGEIGKKSVLLGLLTVLVIISISTPALAAINITVGSAGEQVKFSLPTYETFIYFSENMMADSIKLTSENITFENFKLASGSFIASSQLFSVENENMKVIEAEENWMVFDLTLLALKDNGIARVSSGGRSPSKPARVKAGGVLLSEYGALADLLAAENGWYFDESADIIHIRTNASNRIRIECSCGWR